MSERYDVVGIGNAIMDVIANAPEAFLAERGITKGSMNLIDAAQAETLYGQMGPGIEASGGSAANTIAGCAGLGAKGGFIGRVRDDQLGAVYVHDIRSVGIAYTNPPVTEGLPTARSLILVTPDGQRSMNTFLGASTELGVSDLDEGMIAAADITYLEGYLWDKEPAKAAFLRAMEVAKANGKKVALTLSDSFCVEMHRAEFLNLIENQIDILFANEAEITSLYQTDNFADAAARVQGAMELTALTRSEKGALILKGGESFEIPAQPVAKVVDTTGAGDQFAAGVLAGLTQDRSPAEAGLMGCIAAAEVISHMGPRPQQDVKALVAKAL